jgi:hypothetical protein
MPERLGCANGSAVGLSQSQAAQHAHKLLGPCGRSHCRRTSQPAIVDNGFGRTSRTMRGASTTAASARQAPHSPAAPHPSQRGNKCGCCRDDQAQPLLAPMREPSVHLALNRLPLLDRRPTRDLWPSHGRPNEVATESCAARDLPVPPSPPSVVVFFARPNRAHTIRGVEPVGSKLATDTDVSRLGPHSRGPSQQDSQLLGRLASRKPITEIALVAYQQLKKANAASDPERYGSAVRVSWPAASLSGTTTTSASCRYPACSFSLFAPPALHVAGMPSAQAASTSSPSGHHRLLCLPIASTARATDRAGGTPWVSISSRSHLAGAGPTPWAHSELGAQFALRVVIVVLRDDPALLAEASLLEPTLGRSPRFLAI